jgi:hypothetical protein
MNRITNKTDLSPLIGKNVEQVCIGLHEIIINLEDNLFISIEGAFSFDGGNTIEEDFPSCANSFAQLLGLTISEVTILRDDAVSFNFSNSENLIIFDSSDHYESFQIQLPDQLVVV